MLYFNPPFDVIDDIFLVPDHLDRAQFYYMPVMPHLTTTAGAPQLQLIKYRTGDKTGGFLNFDVDLGVPQSKLDDIADQLKTKLKLDVTPRLAPIPIVDGTVKLLLLGAESTGAAPPPKGTPPAPTPFVVKIQQGVKPSLFGDENATFSVQLDQDGTTIVEQALKGEMSPIGVVYMLDYFALRPAYSVRVSIDWHRVQTHFEESFGVSFMTFSSEVDKVVDKLIEDRAIVIEADTFVPEGEDDTKDITARRDQALAQAREMIKSTFFESSIPPPKAGDNSDKEMAREIVTGLVTGGLSSFASLSYKKVDLTRIDQKSMNANFQERTTVRKTIAPQGHLAGLFAQAANGVPFDHFIVTVNPDDFFAKRKVELIARADFAADGIESIRVSLDYGGKPQTVILEPGKDRQSIDWDSKLDAGVMAREVTYRYSVTFKDADRTQRPVTLETTTLTTRDDKLEIVPRDLLYAILDVPVSALGVPWAHYPAVDVDCRYSDDANAIHQEASFRLTEASPSQRFRIFARDPSQRSFDYRITYRGADSKDLAQPWVTPDNEQVQVRDPYPSKRQLTVVPQLDWNTIDRAFVDLTYDDATASFEMNAKNTASQTAVFEVKDRTHTLVAYEVTILTKAGATITVPKSFTTDRRLIVRADMRGHRVVAIAPDQVSFSDAHVKQIDIEIQYADATNGLSFSDKFTFKSAGDHAAFEFDYVDGAKNRYAYKLTTRLDNGLARETDWTEASDDTLTVPVG
jgi:hypothetical protein